MDHREGVWIVDSVCAVGAAEALRAGLIAVAQAKSIDASRTDALSLLHDYLCGKDFRGRFEPIVETIILMKTDLDTERRGLRSSGQSATRRSTAWLGPLWACMETSRGYSAQRFQPWANWSCQRVEADRRGRR